MKGINISIGIGIGRKRKKYYTPKNLLTTNSGADNVTALNDALTNHRKVLVKAGTYNFNNTIWIPSNTELKCESGVTFQKETGSIYCHIIGNKGMLTNTTDANIKIYGNGLNLDINDIDSYSLNDVTICPILRLRSVFQFHQVDEFIIDNIYENNPDREDQFFMCYSACHYGKISNIDSTGAKDNCPILSCTDLEFTNCNFIASDDAMFLGSGYPNVSVSVNNTERITLTDTTIGSPALIGGYLTRTYGAKWGNWTNGKTYHDNETCLASNGVVYGRGYNTGGDKVASVEPTHATGAVTGADGIEWWKMDGSGYTTKVKDITFKNITFLNEKPSVVFSQSYDEYKDEVLIDNIVFDNIIFPTGYDKYMISNLSVTGNIIIKNSTLYWANMLSAGILTYSELNSSIEKITIDNCNLTLLATKFINMTLNNCTLGELEIKNTIANLTGTSIVFLNTITTNVWTKLTTTDCEFTKIGAVFVTHGIGMLLGDNTIYTRTKFISLERLVSMPYASTPSVTVRVIDCEIDTSIAYVVAITKAGCHVNYISSGTKYIDPTSYLFFNNQIAGDLDINLSNSSGTITPAKVRSSNKVTVTACDLDYV